MTKRKRKGTIERVLNFSQGDLEANKAGFISHFQRQRLWRRCILSQEFFWYTGFTLFFAHTALYVAFNSSGHGLARIVGSVIAGLLAIGIAYGPLWVGHIQSYWQDLRKGKGIISIPRGS